MTPRANVPPFPRDSANAAWSIPSFRLLMFSYLSRKDVKSALRVSKVGYEEGMRVLYHTVDLEKYEEAQVAITWSWANICILHFAVHNITVNNLHSGSSDQTDRILGLFRAFPNLDTVSDYDVTVRSIRTRNGIIVSYEIVYTGIQQSGVTPAEIASFSIHEIKCISFDKPINYVSDFILLNPADGWPLSDSCPEKDPLLNAQPSIGLFSANIRLAGVTVCGAISLRYLARCIEKLDFRCEHLTIWAADSDKASIDLLLESCVGRVKGLRIKANDGFAFLPLESLEWLSWRQWKKPCILQKLELPVQLGGRADTLDGQCVQDLNTDHPIRSRLRNGTRTSCDEDLQPDHSNLNSVKLSLIIPPTDGLIHRLGTEAAFPSLRQLGHTLLRIGGPTCLYTVTINSITSEAAVPLSARAVLSTWITGLLRKEITLVMEKLEQDREKGWRKLDVDEKIKVRY